MEVDGIVKAYSYWTFSDIFEENYFPSVPFHGGFGLMNIHGIPKPIYRAYELLHKLGTELLPVQGSHPTVDTWIVRRKDTLTVLITNHALPRHDIKTEAVQITIGNIKSASRASLARIDDEHANAAGAWKEMGSPEYLDARQLEALQAASAIGVSPQAFQLEGQSLKFKVAIPPQGVMAITLYDIT